MSSKIKVFTPYTEEYKNRCFIIWYAGGRTSFMTKLIEVLPKDEYGRVPKAPMVSTWRNEMNWDIRADELDAKALAKVDDQLILQKAEMLKRQADFGKEMQDKGIAYIRGAEGIDSSASAISAVVKGAELERTSRGMSEFLLKLSKMSDADIKDQILKLSTRAETGNIIDAEEVEKDVTE